MTAENCRQQQTAPPKPRLAAWLQKQGSFSVPPVSPKQVLSRTGGIRAFEDHLHMSCQEANANTTTSTWHLWANEDLVLG